MQSHYNASRNALLQPTQLFSPRQSSAFSLVNPQTLVHMSRPRTPAPPQAPASNATFNRVSSLLADRLDLQSYRPGASQQPTVPLFNTAQPTQAPVVIGSPQNFPVTGTQPRPATGTALGSITASSRPQPRPVLQGLPAPAQSAQTSGVATPSAKQSQRQQIIVNSGIQEWRSGVKESGGSNRGPRIDTYAKNAKFGKGYEWCGFFTAFNYSKAGFKTPEHFASYQKARDFFLYRSYTSRDSGLHARLDQQRASDEAAGSTRQYFAMAESNVFEYVDAYKRYYGHIDPSELKHTWQNIPIQPGDVALFNHGHVGMVVSYDNKTGKLVTIEGNTSGEGPDGKRWTQAVVRKEYDLSKSSDRKRFDGFGRAADSDFA